MRHMDELFQDIRFGFRQLVRKPAVALLIVMLLALGIGVSTTIFSVVKAVLLEPLPFDSPDPLVLVWETNPEFDRQPVSGPTFLDWRAESQSFEHLVAFRPYPSNLTGEGDPERVLHTAATAGLFEALRVQPAIGRTFTQEEEEPGHDKVAILSDGLWRRRFGADPNILGKAITLDGVLYTVIGVMPRGFQNPSPWRVGEQTDVWIPFSIHSTDVGRIRGSHWFPVIGRIKKGISLDAAQEEMSAMARHLEEQYPEDMKDQGVRLVPVREDLVGRYTGQLMMLLGAAGLVLLIACGNVAGILIARATTRQNEVAIRTSLGASRRRVIRQLLTEYVPLFLTGGGLSILFALSGVRVLRSMMPSSIPRVQEIGIDGGVLAFVSAVSIGTGLLFGLIPAFSASKTDLSESLKQGRGRAGTGRSRIRRALVVAQFAVTLVLAHGAALMLESYWMLRGRDQGFRTEGVLTIALNPQGPRYAEPQPIYAFYRQVLERIRAIPGVVHAAATSKLPLEGGTNSWVRVEGKDYGKDRGPLVEMSNVTYDYPEVMGIPLLMGRKLTEQDSSAGQPGVLINQTAAREIWPNENPIGKRFSNNPDFWFTVAGVVGDVRQWGMEREPLPEAYIPHVHGNPYSFRWVRYIVVRTELDPSNAIGPVKEAIWSVDPALPVSDIRTTDEIVFQSMARRRFNTILIGVFAAMGLILVAAGIYGVMSTFVSQRTAEIGIRMALGSNRGGVLKMVLGQGVQLAGVGVAIGLIGVFAATRLTASMVYGLSSTEPTTLAGGIVFLIAIGVLGSLFPALRATRIDPTLALREE